MYISLFEYKRARYRKLGIVCMAVSMMAGMGLHPKVVFAHREDYIGETLVFQTLEAGELEPEYWIDIGRREGEGTFIRHAVAVEHGITNHWMVDGAVTFKSVAEDNPEFDTGRVETRFRFFDEGEQPLDTAVSLEVNAEREDGGNTDTHLEPRLILSKDFDKINVTLNIPVEINLDSGSTAWIPAAGVRADISSLIQVGSELRYDIDTKQGSVIPQIWFLFGHDITLKGGYSIGFDQNPDDFTRVAVEVGF